MTTTPFKFLDSYTKEDIATFFGRERETDELFRLCFTSPILVVYGGSGTGKTSLVQCGLQSRFEETDWLPVLVRRSGDILASLGYAIDANTLTPAQGRDLPGRVANLYLDHFKPVYFIFDQFEELFIFGTHAESEAFFTELGSLLQKERNAHVIVIVREEYLAELTRYERIIPGLIDNRYRVERMARGLAASVVEQLCMSNDIDRADGFAAAMVDRLDPEGQGVELSYLQVYLDRCWRARKGDEPFSVALLDRIGYVDDLLGAFLDEQVASTPEPHRTGALLKTFVSDQGTKRQMTAKEVHEWVGAIGADMPPHEVDDLLQVCVSRRLLKDRDERGRFELLHDALARQIFQRMTMVEKELLEVRQFIANAYRSHLGRGVTLGAADLEYIAPYADRLFLPAEMAAFLERCRSDMRSARQLKRKVNVVSLVGLLLIVASTAYYFYGRSRVSRANELGAIALLSATEDPTYSYLVAEQAHFLEPTHMTHKALINAFHNGPFSSEFDGLWPTVSPDGSFIAVIGPTPGGDHPGDAAGISRDQDRTVTVRDRDLRVVSVLAGHGSKVTTLGFFGDSRHLFTMAADSVLRFWQVDGRLVKAMRLEGIPGPQGLQMFGDRLVSRVYSTKGRTTHWAIYTMNGDRRWQDTRSIDGTSPVLVGCDPLADDGVLLSFSDHMQVVDSLGRTLRTIAQGSHHASLCVLPGRRSFSVFSAKTREMDTYSSTGALLGSSSLWDVLPDGIGHAHQDLSSNGYRMISYDAWPSQVQGLLVLDPGGMMLSRMPVAPAPERRPLFFEHEGHDNAPPDRIWEGGLLLNLAPASFAKDKLEMGTAAMGIPWSLAGRLSRGQRMAALFDPRSGRFLAGYSGPTWLSSSAAYAATLIDVHAVQVTDTRDRLVSYTYRSLDPLVIHHVLDDGSLVLGDGRKRVILVQMPRKEERFPFGGDAVAGYSLSPYGRHVATMTDDGGIHLWTTDGVRKGSMDSGSDSAAIWVKFAPDSAHVAVLGGNSRLGLYTMAGALVSVHQVHVDLRNTANVAAFSADGRSLVLAAPDSTARVITMQGREAACIKGHHGHVLAVGHLPGTSLVVTGSSDSTMRMWRINGATCTNTHTVRRRGEVTSIEPAEDKPYVLATASDSSWFLSDSAGRIVYSRVSWEQERKRPVTHARFSPGREYIITTHRAVSVDTVYLEASLRERPRNGAARYAGSGQGMIFTWVNRRVSEPKTQLVPQFGEVVVDHDDDFQYIDMNTMDGLNATSRDDVPDDILLGSGFTRLASLQGRMARFSPDGRHLYYIDEAGRLRRMVTDPEYIVHLVRKAGCFGPIRGMRSGEEERLAH